MPWFEEKGLLPGRGMPGALPGMVTGAAGAEAAGASGAAGVGAAGAAGAAGATAPGFGAAAGVSSAGSASAAVDFGLAALVPAFLAAGFSGAASAGLASGKASRSFLATGGAIVDEPLLTYSPNSLSFSSATLASIPSSFAMSYTRGSATCVPSVWGQPQSGQA